MSWKNIHTVHTTFIVKGKRKHASDLMNTLALQGPCTTRDVAKFVLRKLEKYQILTINNSLSSNLEKQFNSVIQGRQRKQTGKRKSSEKYPGLLNKKYVTVYSLDKNSKGKMVRKYFLTIKGTLFAFGFEYSKRRMEKTYS